MKRALLLTAFLAAASAAIAAPYYLDYRMPNNPSDPFKYYIDDRQPTAGGLTSSQWNAATQAAFNTWDAVACAYTTFKYQGTTSDAGIPDPRDAYDQFNVSTVWITSSSDPYYDYALAGGVASMSSIPLTYAGNVYQCDIYANGVSEQFSVAATPPVDKNDLQSMVTHELGHCQGLGHSPTDDSVMWAGLQRGQLARTLGQPDVDAICQLYPAQGAVGSPCTGSCTQPTDGGSLSCIQPPKPDGGTGTKICSTGCDPNAPNNCPVPFVCKPANLISGKPGACMPSYGDAITQVGKPCTKDVDCGSAIGLCATQNLLPSGQPAWQDGYCTQQCGAGQAACPAGSDCIDFGSNQFRCMKTCRVGTGDCRNGYACIVLDVNRPAVCISACYSDVDCNGGASSGPYLCRACDGVCFERQTTTAQVGDPCTASNQCGTAQLCLTLTNGSGSAGVCSQSCSNTCSTCPSGSTCHLIGQNSDPWCLRDCVSGSCPTGQRCALLPSGRACVPGCQDSNECPVGTQCVGGECVGGTTDGGCTLSQCAGGGGGSDVLPNPTGGGGGGNGKPPSGGCGCDDVASRPLLALAILFLLGARQRWRTAR